MIALTLAKPPRPKHRENATAIKNDRGCPQQKRCRPLPVKERVPWLELLLMALLFAVCLFSTWYFVDHVLREILARLELSMLGIPHP
jgi:hypothetical protein